jgi:hypothetical protein
MAFEIKFIGDNVAVVHGVTDGSADTALATLPPNPWSDTQVFPMVFGEGCYVEDDGTVAPRVLGALKNTIDIRSTLTSKFFVCLVIRLGAGEGLVRDHSAITT